MSSLAAKLKQFVHCNLILGIGIIKALPFALLQITSTNPEEQQKMFGRHFEMEDELVSHISRKSIDTLKANYRVSMVGFHIDLLS